MKCEEVLEHLDEYVDGGLSGEELVHIEEHISSCTACSEEAESLRFLLQATEELPRSIEPSRDLWSGVEQRLTRKLASPFGRARRRHSWPQLTALAAAAALVIMVGLTVLTRPDERVETAKAPTEVQEPARDVPPPAIVAQEPTVAIEVAEAEADYGRARAELQTVLDQHIDALEPETWAVIEANLTVIDEAVAEIRTALEQDPENGRLVHMLVATHQQGLELVELAARMSRET